MALVIGLIFLLITTLIALTAMSGVVMQERMAGNLRNTSIAHAGAESALRAGEAWIRAFHSRGDMLIGHCRLHHPTEPGEPHVLAREAGTPAEPLDAECQLAMSIADAFRSARNWQDTWSSDFIHDLPAEIISDAQLSDPEGAGMARRPQYMIENLGEQRCTGCGPGGQVGSHGSVLSTGSGGVGVAHVYRVTARSTGATANVIRSVESYYIGIMGDAAETTP
jgi:type IV pilus assembly protein PilX